MSAELDFIAAGEFIEATPSRRLTLRGAAGIRGGGATAVGGPSAEMRRFELEAVGVTSGCGSNPAAD